MSEEIERIAFETGLVVKQLLEQAQLVKGDILVVGCSSSEIRGSRIGSDSSEEIGKTVFKTIYDIVRPQGIFLAAQCCEHLNRALVVEAACAEKYNYEQVSKMRPFVNTKSQAV